MQNDDQNRPGQPPIHTHLPDSIPPEDAKKIVGEAVPHGADYNSPPPEGAGKSMGSGLDNVGGPTMGAAPGNEGSEHAATVRDRDSRADDEHMGNRQGNQQQQPPQGGQSGSQQSGGGQGNQGGQSGSAQGGATDSAQRDDSNRSEGLLPGQGEEDGRYDVAEEVSLDQQSNQARHVGSMQEATKGPHGDKLEDAVARSLGKPGDSKQD